MIDDTTFTQPYDPLFKNALAEVQGDPIYRGETMTTTELTLEQIDGIEKAADESIVIASGDELRALCTLARKGLAGEAKQLGGAPLSCSLKGPVNIEDADVIDRAQKEAENLSEQIDKLANFIMAEVPGEPSQSEGAVDTAIRWMRSALQHGEAKPEPQVTEASRVKVPDGQTPLNDALGHKYLDVVNEGKTSRDNGTGSPYHGHSLEHCLHAVGWVQRDLRLALDAAKKAIATLSVDAPAQTGWLDVLTERQRQVAAEGWTPEHDDTHSNGELAAAASCYAYPDASVRKMVPSRWNTGRGLDDDDIPVGRTNVPANWPDWDGDWWKPGNRRRNLVKAGALILAEIERLDRAAPLPEQKEPDNG